MARLSVAATTRRSAILGLDYHREGSLEADRDLVIFRFHKNHLIFSSLSAEVSIHPKYWKPGVDGEAAFRWAFGPRRWVAVRVGWPDLFNNTVIAFEEAFVGAPDERRYYDRQFLLLMLSTQWQISNAWRAELYGGVSHRGRLSVRLKKAPAENWVRDEDFRYGGWLLQWSPGPALRIGGYLTFVRAETDLHAESSLASIRTQRRVEQTARHGLEAIWRLHQRLLAHLWWEQVRRPEDRIFDSPSQPDIFHRDRERFGALRLRWELSPRWRIQLGYLAATRNSSGLPEATFQGSHHRLESGVRFRFTPQMHATLGVNWELDARRESALYDGGFFQWVALW